MHKQQTAKKQYVNNLQFSALDHVNISALAFLTLPAFQN